MPIPCWKKWDEPRSMTVGTYVSADSDGLRGHFQSSATGTHLFVCVICDTNNGPLELPRKEPNYPDDTVDD